MVLDIQLDLAATMARVAALDEYLVGGVDRDAGSAPGWVTPDELCAADGVALERLLAAVRDRWQTDDRAIQASFVIGEYAWCLLAPVVGAYLVERRVPSLAHHNVAVWLPPDGGPGRLALRTSHFTALAGDPLGGGSDVTTVRDEAALRDALHDEIVVHMRPVIAALRARTPFGARAQWLEVADRAAGAMCHVAELTGDAEGGRREVEVLFHRAGSSLNSPRIRFVTYEHLAVRRTMKLRGACCLTYRLPDQEYCMSCPLLPEPQREQRVRAWIADELALHPRAG